MAPRYLLVVSEADPVAPAVAQHWGTPPATGDSVDGTPIRALAPGAFVLRRPGLHIHDDRLDTVLPAAFRVPAVTLVFPSVHRSESGTRCLTTHPIGNPGPDAEVGGRPAQLVTTAPRLMTGALRAIAEAGASLGLPASFEATHHGPVTEHPSFFVEIGFGTGNDPPADAVAALARLLPHLEEDPKDRIAVGLGGGHYAPHFTELALERRWAFGHLLSRHGLATATRSVVAGALDRTPGNEGFLFARTADAEETKIQGLGRRLRDAEAPKREPVPT